MSSKQPKLPINVAEALTTSRSTRAHSQSELFELGSDGKSVVSRPKNSDKNQPVRPLSADAKTLKPSESQKTKRPSSGDNATKILTPEKVAQLKPGILKSSSEKSLKIGSATKIEPAIVDSHKTELEVQTPTKNLFETPVHKKISFSETIDIVTEVAEKESDDESIFDKKKKKLQIRALPQTDHSV
jgi:hypothetical protein